MYILYLLFDFRVHYVSLTKPYISCEPVKINNRFSFRLDPCELRCEGGGPLLGRCNPHQSMGSGRLGRSRTPQV